MTLRKFLEFIEPGGPPYGMLYGSSIDLNAITRDMPDLLKQNAELVAFVETGDIVQGL